PHLPSTRRTPRACVSGKRGLQPEGRHPPRGVAASGFRPLRKIPHCCLPQESGPCLSPRDRKSTRLNSSHVSISYAVFCLKKKKKKRYIITSYLESESHDYHSMLQRNKIG